MRDTESRKTDSKGEEDGRKKTNKLKERGEGGGRIDRQINKRRDMGGQERNRPSYRNRQRESCRDRQLDRKAMGHLWKVRVLWEER